MWMGSGGMCRGREPFLGRGGGSRYKFKGME